MRSWLKPISIKTLSPTEAAWLAGMFDGEGTLTFYMAGRNKQYKSPVIAIYNNHLLTIETCKTLTGIGAITVKHNRTNPNFVWSVKSQRNIAAFLKQILPYSVTKRERIQNFLSQWQDI